MFDGQRRCDTLQATALLRDRLRSWLIPYAVGANRVRDAAMTEIGAQLSIRLTMAREAH
jgi:hypothetical protein